MFELQKSNFNLVLNFCEFNDLINIHSNNFSQQMHEFEPESFLTSVLTEINEIFDYKPVYQPDKLPDLISADHPRIKYILLGLL